MNNNFTHTISDHLKNVWAMLTDDEALCNESDDWKFYTMVKEKYGLSREEVRLLTLGRGAV
jgi:hypothetical protein